MSDMVKKRSKTFGELYASLSGAEKVKLADKVDTSRAYLYQLANRTNGRRPSLGFMLRLVEAEPSLSLTRMAEEFAKPAKPGKES